MSNQSIDLTSNSLAFFNGAYVLRADSVDNAGSGNISTFLKLKNSPTESGSNIDTPIQLNSLPTLELAGNTFREVRLDLNEKNSKSEISLTEFKVFDASNNHQAIFSLDASVLMDASFQSGSSSGDTLFYIPDTAFAGLSGDSNIYFYAKLENSDGGFEEFYVADVAAVNADLFAIDGQVFDDLNADGDNESGGDPGLSDVTVNLYLDNGDGILNATDDVAISTTSTDENGAYSFTNVLPGEYIVEQEIPTGFVQTPLGSVNYQAIDSGNATDIDFGNFELGSISGQQFEDLNGDGVKDAGEEGLENGTIFIDVNDNGTLDAGEVSTTTDANGDYSFTDLTAGNYIIRQVQQDGWVQTTGDPSAIHITSGKNAIDVDFGNQPQQTDLQIIKEFTATFKDRVKIVNPGEEASFTLTATNAGPADAEYILIEDAVDPSLINLELTLPESWINLDDYDPDEDGTLDGIDADNDGTIDFIGDGDVNTIEVLIPELVNGESGTITVNAQVDNSDVVEFDLFGQLGADNSALQEYANVAFSGTQFFDLNFTKEAGSSIVKFNYNDITNTANISGFNISDLDTSNNSSTDELKVSRSEIVGELGNGDGFVSFANSTEGENDAFLIDVDWGSSGGGSYGNNSEFLDPDSVGSASIDLFWDNKAALEITPEGGLTFDEFLALEADGDLTDSSDEQAILDYMIQRIEMGDATADKFISSSSAIALNNGEETQSITVAKAQTTIGLGEIDLFIVVTNSGVFYADESGVALPGTAPIVSTNNLQAALEDLPDAGDSLTGLKIFIDADVTQTRLEDAGLNAVFDKNYLLPELEMLGSAITFNAQNQVASLDLSLVKVIAAPGTAIEYNGENSGDTITGSSLAETISGNNGVDAIAGGNGDDTLLGGNGGDRIRGDGGNDWLIGGQASDVLRGGFGTDTLIGGDYDVATDTISNDGATDIYVLEENAGLDIVRGYDKKKDKIGLLGIEESSLSLTVSNGNTLISLGGEDLMLLEGMTNANQISFTTEFDTI